MQSYIEATENTAMRLKQLSDDMLKYSLAFGETEKSVRLENYDLRMLLEQIFSEHILLLREKGYTLQINASGQNIKEGSQLRTDAQNLMRIVDNVFSNLAKYADIEKPITINVNLDADTLVLTFDNYVRKDTEGTESNKIGLKTCVRLASLVAEGFTYERLADRFVCRLYLRIMDGSSIV
jgi:signal transduction histidine kinase